ncbi:MAG: ribbon-helix-helix protein, CopG family [Xanthomonadales bacterium]|nr:ribbon-helix-helix protein, CopG family [Xanthomonadales bacterium]
MHRTQIYFDEPLFAAIRQRAARANLSISAYIRELIQKELELEKELMVPVDFSGFAGLWEDSEISQESLRQKAWK